MKSQIISKLFNKLNQSQVLYCHWKSTDHLQASFEARTDLDVLVDGKHAAKCETVLYSLGFVRARTPDFRTYPCVEDFICFDPELQRWIHFHLHYQLPCGDRWVKSYRIPIEDYILSNRIYLEEFGIYNIDPVSEYLFFIARMHMKWRIPQRKKSVLKENQTLLRLLARNRNDDNDFESHPLYFDEGRLIVRSYYLKDFDNISIRDVLLFKRHLKKFRRFGTFKFLALNAIRYLLRLHVEFYRRVAGDYSFGRRTLVSGGRAFAFVGMDGSGKSSMIDEVYNTFGKQIDVSKVFLGTGRSGAGWLRKFVFRIYDFRKNKHRTNDNVQGSAKNLKRPGLGKLLWIFLCLRDRNHQLKKLNRGLANGKLVLVDRWPQQEIDGFADGARLTPYRSSKGLLGFISRMERDFYERISKVEADSHLWFDIEPATSLTRKPNELSIELATSYREILKTLSNSIYSPCSIVDAERPYDEVKSEACAIIWGRVSGKCC